MVGCRHWLLIVCIHHGWVALYGYIRYPYLDSVALISGGVYSDYVWIYCMELLRYMGMRTRSVDTDVYMRTRCVHVYMDVYVICVHIEFVYNCQAVLTNSHVYYRVIYNQVCKLTRDATRSIEWPLQSVCTTYDVGTMCRIVYESDSLFGVHQLVNNLLHLQLHLHLTFDFLPRAFECH
jgi:hypothetical protein